MFICSSNIELNLIEKKRLPTGKVSKELLERYVFTHLGEPSLRVISGPHIGEDAAVLDMGDKTLVAKANPITGAEAKIGWLSVHINANDVASRGATPLWFLNTILLPEDSDETLLKTIMIDIHEACKELGICIVGGHTEVAPGLQKPIIAGFMLGEVTRSRLVTTGGAKPEDDIILTKGAGIEGTGILAEDLKDELSEKVSSKTLENAKKLLNEISVVKEAQVASKIGVHSMHTPTEGGVINGLLEVSEAANVSFKVYEDKIPLLNETKQISNVLKLDPLKLLSSGSLLITSDTNKTSQILDALNEVNIRAEVIGKITKKDHNIIVGEDGKIKVVQIVKQDELYRILDERRNI